MRETSVVLPHVKYQVTSLLWIYLKTYSFVLLTMGGVLFVCFLIGGSLRFCSGQAVS